MDVLGVQQMKMGKGRGKRCNKIEKGIKVVYISSPMKVKTCASKFRALVQELTGKDSDSDAAALRFSGVGYGAGDPLDDKVAVVDQDADVHTDHSHEVSSAEGSLMSSRTLNSEASLMEPFDHDDLFMTQREGSFLGLFTSNLFHHDFNFQLDQHALKSFD